MIRDCSVEFEDCSFGNIIDGLLGSCFPYGSESYDDKRFSNLLCKLYIVEKLIDEIIEAGKLHNRKESSISKISFKANEYLADLRDCLCNIEYLRERVEE